ncbi:MAG: bifunctional 23S rRNA (guanine(2069)-N(7))-methyltransferase RlmK/23S rRNA (guanine(2445)-N(2))-methyltransferase RlmL [Deltaproteobacteria bacterium]|nr:bifunctional 23S rRNA (guanine(2069)-N(7))-methyltransferase RlmK/23S rRNA (guanine(2445)-N(2))-methyltransferase RlmL [Deltaproteobacteria bacterium]
MLTTHDLFATVPRGLETALVGELAGLGADDCKVVPGGVHFQGTLETAYRACLWTRSAAKVLLPIARFRATDETGEGLYAGAAQIAWTEHLGPEQTFAVEVTLVGARLTNASFAALKVKDAVVDRLRAATGSRPSVDRKNPDVRVHAYLERDHVTLSLDLAGESLHRRGYRPTLTEAPLKENLAAGLLLLAGWPELAAQGATLLDPMCGSGTFLVEGALLAAGLAPGLLREKFGFTAWRGHDASLWRRVLAEAEERKRDRTRPTSHFVGYDADHAAVNVARTCARRAGVSDFVTFEARTLEECTPPEGLPPGLLVANPPYGVRIGQAQALPALYAQLGDVLKRRFGDWTAQLLVGEPELVKALGLRPTRKERVFNGPIECRWLRYPLRAPARKADSGTEKSAPATAAPLPSQRERLASGSAGEAFANRVTKDLRHFGRWARRAGVTCYRVYDADLPDFALAIDRYEKWVVVQEYAAPKSIDPEHARARLRLALTLVPELFEVPPTQVFLKVRQRQKGHAQYERLADKGQLFQVHEGGHTFFVNFTDYLDTGLFLDHRQTRELIGTLAAGRTFLNLFSYTGTATVYAANGGARHTTSVDLSRTYLDWAERNFALAGLRGASHELVQADCLRWIERARDRYGLIFLDPPTFSTSKRMEGTLDVARDHVALIRSTLRLLEPDGVLLFSTNHQRFKLDQEALSDLALEDLSRATLPPDFARSPRIHQTWKIARPPGRERPR